MKKLLFKCLTVLMILTFATSTVLAEANAAMLYSNGNFSLNGEAATRSSAILPGDRIQTPESTSVSLTRSGANVLVGSNSSVIYQGDAIEVASGNAMVSTSTRLSATVKDIKVSPAQDSGSYRVTRSNGDITIDALKGNVLLASGKENRTLAEGSYASMPDPDAPQHKGGAVPAASRMGNAGSSLKIGLIAAGVAAAATSVIVLTVVDKGCDPASVSPACP